MGATGRGLVFCAVLTLPTELLGKLPVFEVGRLPVFEAGKLPVFDPLEDVHGDEPLPNIPPKIDGALLLNWKVLTTRFTNPQKHTITAKPIMLHSRYIPRSLFSFVVKKYR